MLRIDTEVVESDLRSIIQNVNQQLIQNREFEQLPFEALVRGLNPKRDLSRSPIFQVMVNYLNNENVEFNFDGATISPAQFDYEIAKYDLTFDINEIANGDLVFTIEYSTD